MSGTMHAVRRGVPCSRPRLLIDFRAPAAAALRHSITIGPALAHQLCPHIDITAPEACFVAKAYVAATLIEMILNRVPTEIK